MNPLRVAGAAVAMFLCFALACFLSALVRASVATRAPAFSADLGLDAADLGLLAGAYFLGFACVQLPLGSALDRAGPKRVLLAFLSLAVIGCGLFAMARSFAGLTAARALIGMVASTLPVHWLLPQVGWRGLFWLLAAAFAVAMLVIACVVRRDEPAGSATAAGCSTVSSFQGAFALLAPGCIASYVWFLWFDDHASHRPLPEAMA